MKKPETAETTSSDLEKLTLYINPEHQELVRWVQEYTHTESLSEAVFLALAELKKVIKERQLQALEQIHGIWKDDAEIDDALKKLQEGRDTWRRRLEES